MADAFMGQLALFPYKGVPAGWLQCNGQLVQIAQYTPLFSLIGNIYGGDGVRTFAVPNLTACVTVGQGRLPGGSSYAVGQTGGVPAITLITDQLPSHSHGFPALATPATTNSPVNAQIGEPNIAGRGSTPVNLYTRGGVSSSLRSGAIEIAGGSGPHNNLQPYIVLNWCISTAGIYPSRP